ncbi:MAG: isopentenyl phosphate kinase [Caldisphaera sp.]
MSEKMVCKKIVIKLGGSFITDKKIPLTIDWNSLEEFTMQLNKFYKEHGGVIVIVHGGGSFGHYEVERIKRNNDRIDQLGVSTIQKSMITLGLAVIDIMIKNNLPVSLHPAHTICKNEIAENCNYEPILNDIKNNLIPVTFGDAIFYKEGKIISGDDLSIIISNIINADCLLFASDVQGIYDENGNVIKTLDRNQNITVIKNEGFDVTGGILNKVKKAFKSNANEVRIIQGKKIYDALVGKDIGTKILNR